jgi:hypothetical protein
VDDWFCRQVFKKVPRKLVGETRQWMEAHLSARCEEKYTGRYVTNGQFHHVVYSVALNLIGRLEAPIDVLDPMAMPNISFFPGHKKKHYSAADADTVDWEVTNAQAALYRTMIKGKPPSQAFYFFVAQKLKVLEKARSPLLEHSIVQPFLMVMPYVRRYQDWPDAEKAKVEVFLYGTYRRASSPPKKRLCTR